LQGVHGLLTGDDRAVLYVENSLLPWLEPQDVVTALRGLAFREDLVAVARDIIDRHAGGPYVGIHLRATDFTSPPPTDPMLAAVQAQSDTRFFVCSDDPELEARFAAFPNVFLHPKTAVVQKRFEGPWRAAVTDSDGLPYGSNIERNARSVVEAVVDLLLLAGSRPLKTSNSSFLALAGLLRRSGVLAGRLPLNLAGTAPEEPAPAPPPDPITTQREVIEVLDLIRPLHMVTDVKVRIGGDADGGYVMPSLALKSTAVLSIGIGDQVSFDAELADRGAIVQQYDHTIPEAPLEHANFRFHRLGWGPDDHGELRSIHTMMRGMDWAQARNPILKFDTEGAEWACLNAASSEDLARFAVIAGEFHGLHNLALRTHLDLIRGVFHKLHRTHAPVHLHANNATGIQLVHGVPVPPLVEITFVRRNLVVLAGHSNEPIPGPLDRPNMTDRPDICLRAF
jgi:hypothetical protein